MKSFKEELIKLNVCGEAIKWVADKTMKEAWEQCHRGDWMLWLYFRKHPNNIRKLTLAKAHCANTVRYLMKDERSIRAVDVAIRYGERKATDKELDSAYDSASAAVYAVCAYAAFAPNAAASASDVYATPEASAIYAVYAYTAYTAYTLNADAVASADAKTKIQKETANICRKYLKI